MKRLTRRNALLAMIGGTVTSTVALYESKGIQTTASLSDDHIDTLLAVTDVVYPSVVTVSEDFITGYVDQLNENRVSETKKSIVELNRLSRKAYGKPFYAVSGGKRNQLLRYLGVDRVQSRPEGTLSERIRYHLVNSLLYLLFTTPKGSTVSGIENPVGYPGGLQSYQQKP